MVTKYYRKTDDSEQESGDSRWTEISVDEYIQGVTLSMIQRHTTQIDGSLLVETAKGETFMAVFNLSNVNEE